MPDWAVNLICGLGGAFIAAGLAGLGAAVAWGRIKQKLEEVSSLKKGLYRDDGTLVYVPAIDCEKQRTACAARQAEHQMILCNKIEAVSKDLKAAVGQLSQISTDMAVLAEKANQRRKEDGQ